MLQNIDITGLSHEDGHVENIFSEFEILD